MPDGKGFSVATGSFKWLRAIRVSQEVVVIALTVLAFVVFSWRLPGFLEIDNLLSLIQNVAILGLLGIGMAVVIIGRGIDLSIVAVMAISVGWTLNLLTSGMGLPMAMVLGLGAAIGVGILNGVLVAYVDIPPLFATLAMASVVYGFGQVHLIDQDTAYMPKGIEFLRVLGSGRLFGVPMAVVVLAACAIVGAAFLRYTKHGRFVIAIGDNPAAARIKGVPVRPLTILQYVFASVVAYVAGIVMATAVNSMDTRVANSTYVYDVILVVVLGGVGLSGAKGGVRNVLIGTVMIGVLFNGMTIMNLDYYTQIIVKGLILLITIAADSFINPRDEQVAQQGDI